MIELQRADLHVHTCHSKICGTLTFLGSRDSYSRPDEVYRIAKARGMDYVAFTDHDSVDGALELLSAQPDLDDVIVGEEVTCWLPDTGIEVHLGVYGVTEALHRDLQPLRENVFDVAGYLREGNVFFALNHLLHFYRGQIPPGAYLRLINSVPALEARNGTMVAAHNLLIERLVQARTGSNSLAMVAGSDAHTLRRVGRTWTAAPGGTRDEFMANVARGLGRPGGEHGGVTAVAGDAYGVIRAYVAALSGVGPQDVHGWRRAGCLAFAAASVPGQLLLPVAVAAAGKAAECREVRRMAAYFDRPAAAVRPTARRREWEA